MRELKVGNLQVRVRATPLALLYYKQEFKRDVLGDLASFQSAVQDKGGNKEIDLENLDMLKFLQLIWAMAKADDFGKGSFPSFQEWLSQMEYIDLADPELFVAALEEAADGFFRSAKGSIKKQ